MIIETIKALFLIIGAGVILHYYAYAVAWGIRKGQAKVVKTDIINVNLNK